MVECERKGPAKDPTNLGLERIYMAHECGLGWPGEGNIQPSGVPGMVIATDKN
jgi:hypothetical protein